MELSKRQRDLISRATALLVGVALAIACLRTIGVIRTIIAEQEHIRSVGRRGPVPAVLFGVVAATGLPALLLIGFALVPSRWLYKLDPSPSRADGSDVVAGGLHSLLP